MDMACITRRIKNREHGEECQLREEPVTEPASKEEEPEQ